jgi:hypothetical protein
MGETHAERLERWKEKGHRTSVQCSGHTKTGARCKRRTARSPFCFYHLEKEEHVKIKESAIPHSGMGLYTTVPRRAGQKIAFYGKDPYVDHHNQGGDYVLQVKQNPPTFVNPWKTSDSAGRFSNMARRGAGFHGQGSNNAAIGYSAAKHEAFLKAKTGIPAGREVKTTYGANAARDYW